FDIDAALEAVTRVGRDSELPPCSADPSRIERGNFEENISGFRRDFAATPADHARNRLRTLGIADDNRSWRQRAIDPIQSLYQLLAAGFPDDDGATRELFKVERMHRLTKSVEHVVRYIDHVVDRARAN